MLASRRSVSAHTFSAPMRCKLAGSVALIGLLAGGAVQAQTVAPTPSAPVVILSPVTVQGSGTVSPEALPEPYAGGQMATGGRLGLLGNSDTMKTPFSVTSFTSEAMRNQQAVTASDVLTQDSSVRSTSLVGGMVDSFFIRGFPIGEGNIGEIAFDGQYGVAPNYRVFTEYAERVEVIKGPAALLYGMSPNSGVGGVINIVPKRAGEDLTRVTGSFGGSSQLGGHLDMARRYGKNREFGIRFNGSYGDGDTAIDHQSREAGVGALSLDYKGERLRASLDLLAQEERYDSPVRPFLLGAGVPVPSAASGERNVTQSWEWSKLRDQSALLRGEYDVTDAVTVFANVGGGNSDVDRVFGTPTITNSRGDTSTPPQGFRAKITRMTYDAGARAKFDTAALKHSVTVQAGGYQDTLERGLSNGTAYTSNIYNPITRPMQSIALPSIVPKLSDTELFGLAAADTISMVDGRVQLTVGVRQQRIQSNNYNITTGAVTTAYDESATTPMAGLVVQPWERVSLYANYIEGLSKGDVAPATARNFGEVMAPYKAKQYEVGVKVDFGRFTTTLAAFQITKPSGAVSNNIFSASGEQRVRGLELNGYGEATAGLRLMGGVTLMSGELTKTPDAASRGKDPIGVPTLQANLGAEWDMPWVEGLTLTGALAYSGKQYVDTVNARSLDAWTRVDLGARYTTDIAGRHTVFRAGVQNVFDSSYWSGVASGGWISQAAPRTFLISASVDL